jgi:hypothetical protein
VTRDEDVQDLREAITLLAIAALEPRRFTFDLHLLALGLNGEDRSAAHLVVGLLLGAAEGEELPPARPEWHPFLQRLNAHRQSLAGVRYDEAVEMMAAALDLHANTARTLLDAHMHDGKGESAHRALRR